MRENIKDIAIRAIKTGMQTAVSMLTVGQLVTEVNWLSVLSISAMAMIISVLTNAVITLEKEGY